MDGSISCGAASTLLDSNVVGCSPSALATVSSLRGNSAGLCGVRGSSVGMKDISSTPGTRQSSDRDKLVGSLLLSTFLFFWCPVRPTSASASAFLF
jgi:hypothetical protein